MAIYTDRIVLVFPIAAKNRQAAASLQTLEITDAGKEFETLVPLDPALVSQYASQFNLPLLEKVTELEADLATTTSQLEATTQAKIALDLRVATLTTEKQTLTTDLATANATIALRDITITTNTSEIAAKAAIIESLTNDKENLQERYDETVATLEAEAALSESLQAKVTFLNSIRTYNPRILKGKAFYKRISQSDMEILLTSEIPQLVTVGKTILAYRDNDWPVIIDSDDFQTLVGYVYMSGIFDTEEVAEVLRDATRDEAYIT